MRVDKFVLGELATNTYLALNEETKECVLVDPAECKPALVNHIRENGWKVVGILLTHGHYDHIEGAEMFSKIFKVPMYAHEAERETMMDPVRNLSSWFGAFTLEGITYVKDGDIISLAGYDFEVLFTPGHTAGGCCYYVKSESQLFCGDTLFNNSIGRTDFPDGSMLTLLKSIKEKLFVLPRETVCHTGHMEETTIGFEMDCNPFIHEEYRY